MHPLSLRWGLWVKRRRQACEQEFDWSFLKDVIQLYAIGFRIFSPFSPHSAAFTWIWSSALHYTCKGVRRPQQACKCNKSLLEATWGKLCKSYATLRCQFRIFGPFSFHTPPLTSTCNHALHYACDGPKEDYSCNKSLIEATGGKLFNFMLFSFVLLQLPYPKPPACTFICGNAICGSKEACMCNVSNEAFGEKLFNFLLFNFWYLVLCHPTPLRSHAFVGMQSIMIAMGSVRQEKLARAIMV